MNGTLPEELLDTIQQQVLLRQRQLQQLSLFYNKFYPSPTALVAYGPEDTCKHETIETVLRKQGIDYALIDCRECLSQRHLLSKIFAKCVRLMDKEDDVDTKWDRLDNINALASNLRKLLEKRREKLILVVTGADQARGATATLLPALARLGALIPCLSLILTSTSPRPLLLHKSGIPYIHFPPYKRNEAVQILLRDPPPLLPDPLPDYSPNISSEKLRGLFSQFATVVYDTLISPTTISLLKFRQTCIKLWPRFIWPVVSGEPVPGTRSSTDWDFARLVSMNRGLFQAEGEEALQDRLISASSQLCTFEEFIAHKAKQDVQLVSSAVQPPATNFAPVQPPSTIRPSEAPSKPLLKYLPTLLLLSAYLASHTPAKHDIVLFSRLSTASATSRRKRKYLARSRAGGISKTPTKSAKKPAVATDEPFEENDDQGPTTPTSKKKTSKELGMQGDATPKKERADRSMRAIFEKTSNIARPFALERVIAILRAIHPDGVGVSRGIADRVYVELGELERLRLVVRVDGAGKGGSEDILEERWKCIVGKEWVVSAGAYWGVGLEGWEVE